MSNYGVNTFHLHEHYYPPNFSSLSAIVLGAHDTIGTMGQEQTKWSLYIMLRYLGRASIWQLTSHTRTHITYISILKPEQNGRNFAEMLMVSIADQRNRVLHDKLWLNVHVINHIGIHLNYLFSRPAMCLHFVLFSIHCLGCTTWGQNTLGARKKKQMKYASDTSSLHRFY